MSTPLDIAVIGLAGCYAGARDARAFWQNILDKVDAMSDADAEWIGPYLDPEHAASRNDRIYTARGGFLRELAEVDPAEFGVMPSMADGGEPDHLLALKHARDALADAGYMTRPFNRQRAGIVLGRGTYTNRGNANGLFHGLVVDQTMDIIKNLRPDFSALELEELRAAFKKQLPPYSGEMVGPLTPNVITGMIANRLDLMGPNYLVDAACASSLIAIDQAVRELVSGRSDLMLAGGVHAHTPPQLYIQFCQISALAHGELRPFQKGSDGTLLGEGVGILTLKRLADAERDGDRIYAVIKGIGVASDGKAKGLLTPRLEGEVLALKRAYESSGIDPASVGLIEAHGTGTPVGDRTEIQALSSLFGPRSGTLPSVAVGTVKSMISHCLPASGSAAMIKTILALHHKVLPPTLCGEPEPELELERTPFYLNTEPRPWIHGGAHPRRAGVNAFGFGGINAHVILEEYRKPQAAQALQLGAPRSSELVMLAAESAAGLAELAAQVLARLRQTPAPALAEVAKAAAAQAVGEHRLALVCESIDDLAKKLEQALAKLRRPEPEPFKTRAGMHYGRGPAPGRVCFLFPGEGSQYPNMLADLCMHFPRLREWFDFVDEIAASFGSPLRAPVLFPPPTALSEAARGELEARLFDMDVAAELVFAASLGLHAILDDLGLRADAMLGHSTGENTALTVCGVRRFERRAEIAESVRELNRIYRKLLDSGEIAQGTLLTVGALRPEARARLLRDPGRMRVAMDNCPNQLVLFGAPADARALKAQLTADGAVCAELPFDRPYHTPLFKPVADAYRAHFAGLEFGAGSAQLYSACSAAPFPQEPAAIRELAVAQWQNPVRFVETVERLYADGVRVFIEVGPSGNLVSFVADTLREHHDVVAVASNSRRRPGLTQLQHMLAQVYAAGVSMRPEALFAHRDIANIDLAALPRLKARPKLRLKLQMPSMRVPDEWKPANRKPQQAAPAVDAHANVVKLQRPAPRDESAETQAAAPLPSVPVAAPAPADPRQQALQAHFALMQEFLESQARVLTGFGLSLSSQLASVPSPAPAPADADPDFPLLGRIVELSAERLIAERSYDCAADLFLRDHCIGVAPSQRKPELMSMSCIPFTFSMETLAQAAARLVGGGCKVIAIEDSRGSRWLALDEERLSLRIVAERSRGAAAGEELVSVRLFQFGEDQQKLPQLRFEGQVRLAHEYPQAPSARPWSAPSERAQRNNPDAELYRRGMFHGPRLQGVKHLRRWGETALEADLVTIPTHDYFSFTTQPRFQCDAALLDAAGQLTAYWLTEKFDWSHSCFPFHVGRYAQYCDPPPAGTRLVCRGALRLAEENRLEAQFDVLDESGRLIARVDSWEARTFEIPARLAAYRLDPQNRFLSQEWLPGNRGLPGLHAARLDYLDEGFLERSWRVWMRVLANMVLCESERRTFYGSLPASGPRRENWLMGRIAAKDAVRNWARAEFGIQLAPADIEIAVMPPGRPYLASCVGLPPDVRLPAISISHSGRTALAVCDSSGSKVGADYQRIERIETLDLIAGAFTAAEAQLFAAVAPARRRQAAVALWCAREAAAKAAGTGLWGRPHEWVVVAASFGADDQAQLRVRFGSVEYAVDILLGEHEVFALCRTAAPADASARRASA